MDNFIIEDQYGNSYVVKIGDPIFDRILRGEFDGCVIPFGTIIKNMPWGYWKIIEKLEEDRQSCDVKKLIQPPTQREFSFDITRLELLNNEQLGEMLSYYGSYTAYMNAQLGMIAGELAGVRGHIFMLENEEIAKGERNLPPGRRPLKDTLLGEAIANNEYLRSAKMREAELEAQYKQAEGYRDAWKGLYETASRELTRRQIQFEQKR